MKKHVKLLVLGISLLLSLTVLAGCASAPQAPSEQTASADAPDTEAGDALSQEPSAEEAPRVLLVVSFGTSYNETRDATIGAIESALQAAYPDYEVRRAFTSQTIINILREREGLEIDNVEEAMGRLIADGVREVVIQPTHIMNGYEYDDLVAESAAYQDSFESLRLGEPLLLSDADFDKVVTAITSETETYTGDDTAIVFMGHGTEHAANATYQKLQDRLHEMGYDHYFVGTVEGSPELEDVIPLVEASGATKVVLLPLMVVAGDHATNDMAGDDEDSWKSGFEAAGYEVECVLKGLGEYAGIREIYVEHVADAFA